METVQIGDVYTKKIQRWKYKKCQHLRLQQLKTVNVGMKDRKTSSWVVLDNENHTIEMEQMIVATLIRG